MLNTAITILFVLIIVVWFGVGWSRQDLLTRELGGTLKKLTDGLSKLDFTRVHSPQHLETIEALFSQSGRTEPFQLGWHEFRESLTMSESDGRVQVRNTEQASAFFCLTKLNKAYVNQNLSSIGSSLMTLGILGTFVGLTVGLWGFQMGDTDQVKDSIQHLIDGMQTAFVTSVVGIMAGIMYNAKSRQNRAQIMAQFETFISEMDHKFQRQTAQEIQSAILKEARSQSSLLSTLSEDFALSLNSAMQTHLVPALAGMNDTLASIGESALRTQSDAMDSMVTDFLEKMNASLKDNFSDLTKHLENAVERAERFGESLERSHSSLAGMVDKQERLQVEIQALIGNTEAVLRNSNEYLTKMSEVNEDMGQTAQSFTASAKEITSHLERLTDLSADFMESSRNFEASSQAMNQMWERHRDTVRESIDTLDNGIKSYTHQTTENLGNSLSQFEDSLNEGVGLFGRASSALAENLQDLEEFFEQIHQRVQTWEKVGQNGHGNNTAIELEEV